MSEFSNRISAQRTILRTVNRASWEQEALLGLSKNAIERWIAVNRIDQRSLLVHYVTEAGDKLFFLANKSQEQISEEYQTATEELEALTRALEREVADHR